MDGIRTKKINNEVIYCRLSIAIAIFLCPCDDSQGALRFTPVHPSLSICPSFRHSLRYRVCVINFSHSFQWIFLKPCIPTVDILKMCMWVFDGARINFDRIIAYRTYPSHFRQLLHCRVWSLCNQLLLQFSMDHFETMQTCCGYIE